MQIFLKQFSGGTILLEVDSTLSIADVANIAYQQRASSAAGASLENYIQSIQLTRAGRLLNFDKTLADYGIVESSTIHELPASFTMSPDFNWETLSIIDAISQETMSRPYILNPGCAHVFEALQLRTWVRTCLAEGRGANCPTCRMDVSRDHVLRLLMLRPQPTVSES